MEIDIEKFDKLRELRERREELSRLEDELVRPVLTDYALLDRVYEIFRSQPVMRKRNRYVVRKQFIFIAVWLFDPGALADRKMRRGLRGRLARVMGLRSPNIISAELKDLLFYYLTYPEFRRETDEKFRGIIAALGFDENGSRPD